ncbi:MAG TPA: dephospho-CoA kinase [Saprospiraceae bacterium]|nr:dephospho-CoA kinase [Saprospiraceae bacterium]
MLKVGLTGGIGSGKSTVASIFSLLGVPVYIADLRAHELMIRNQTIREKIIALLGVKAYDAHHLPDRKYIAAKVFEDKGLLENLNSIIHPVIRDDFESWCTSFSDRFYIIQEAAVLFESGGAALMNENILVWAPEDLRMKRVMARDRVAGAEVQARMQVQLADEDKAAQSQFLIINDNEHSLIRQVLDIDQALRFIAQTG